MKTSFQPSVAWRTTSRGLSLIELLVAMAVGLVVTLVISAVLINSERIKLTSTKLNTASQTGAYASLVLDRDVRNAGSGFTQSRSALGCLIDASVNVAGGTLPLLPPPGPLPAPFNNILAGTPISLAPAVIIDGGGANGSDQIVVMAGTHGFGETPRSVSPGSVTGANLVVSNAAGMVNGDLVLVSTSGAGTAGQACMLQQHGAPLAENLPMAGPFFAPSGVTRTLASYGAAGGVVVSSLGRINPVAGDVSNPPSFKVYGVGDGSRLFSYDLLNTSRAAVPAAETVAEGVFTMHALYGTGTASISAKAIQDGAVQPPRVPLTWNAPVGPTFGIGALWPAVGTRPATTVTAQGTLATIQAVRIAMVLQSNLQEKDPAPGEVRATPANELVLFPDLPLAQQVRVPLTPAQQNFRYRIVDTIIPVRNI